MLSLLVEVGLLLDVAAGAAVQAAGDVNTYESDMACNLNSLIYFP